MTPYAEPPAARRILVTGGGGDIGGALRERLLVDGDEVIRLSHRPDAGADLVADFRDDADLLEKVRGIDGRLDGAAICHGIVERGRLGDIDEAAWRRMLDVNLNSVYTILHALAARLDELSSIVVVSSTAGLDRSRNGGPHYTASKAALNGLVRHLARDLGPLGVRVNAVCPGHIAGSMSASMNTAETEATGLANIPMRRAGEPQEVANVIRYLLSPSSSYVTGAIISVAGGTHR